MWKRTLSAAIACLSLSLFIVPMANAAEAGCACMCVDAEPMYVCTGGFVNSQTTTTECSAQLHCPAVTDPPPDVVPPITHANNPDVPPGLECRPRNVWRPDLGRYKEYRVCSPRHLVASNDSDQDRHGRKHRKHKSKKSDKSDKSKKSKKHRRHHRRHHDDDDD